MQILGLSTTEAVALAARPTADRPLINNEIFDILLTNQWEVLDPNPITGTYQSVQNPEIVIPAQIWALQVDQLTLRSVRNFRIPENQGALMDAFSSGWTYLMNADRFDGPTGNVCDNISMDASGPVSDMDASGPVSDMDGFQPIPDMDASGPVSDMDGGQPIPDTDASGPSPDGPPERRIADRQAARRADRQSGRAAGDFVDEDISPN